MACDGDKTVTAMTTVYITHDDCLLHEMGYGHPECPDRLRAINDYLESTQLGQLLRHLEPRPVSQSLLAQVHPLTYIDWLDQIQPRAGHIYADPDTALNRHSVPAARLAAGAVELATELVLRGDAHNAFCAVRPPGHHAETATAMGFCLFNNIAIGIERALAEPGIERVAVLDFDVHHCNGTIDLYKDRPEVLICSSFQHPFYPYRYFDIVRPNIINTPLKAGTTGVQFRRAVEAGWLPALQAHRPDMLFISAGFDAHRDDPLGQLLLDETDYAWVSSLITDAAAGSANGRIVSTLEGGYNLSALARSVGAYLEVLLGA